MDLFSQTPSGKEQEPVYVIVEKMPTFQYGNCNTTLNCFLQYVADSIRMPKGDECFGRVIVRFVVERDSTLSSFEVMRGLDACPACNDEAIRVVKSMPKWIPATQRGRNVRVALLYPVDFKQSF
ncbi:MAG: energy transducer TonB [Bacteroidales bacterium]|nr:energy transducer TonB [Bacteroidales bacterium]